MAYLRKTRTGVGRWVAQIPDPAASGKLLQKSIRARNQREAD
jgi:hypothetical protein